MTYEIVEQKYYDNNDSVFKTGYFVRRKTILGNYPVYIRSNSEGYPDVVIFGMLNIFGVLCSLCFSKWFLLILGFTFICRFLWCKYVCTQFDTLREAEDLRNSLIKSKIKPTTRIINKAKLIGDEIVIEEI